MIRAIRNAKYTTVITTSVAIPPSKANPPCVRRGAGNACRNSGSSSSPETGFAAERKWFLASSGTDGSKRAMAAYVDEAAEQGPGWADPERIRSWQDGTAADLLEDREP